MPPAVVAYEAAYGGPVETDGQTVASGMDVVVLSEDDRISLLAVFDGATPPGLR